MIASKAHTLSHLQTLRRYFVRSVRSSRWWMSCGRHYTPRCMVQMNVHFMQFMCTCVYNTSLTAFAAANSASITNRFRPANDTNRLICLPDVGLLLHV